MIPAQRKHDSHMDKVEQRQRLNGHYFRLLRAKHALDNKTPRSLCAYPKNKLRRLCTSRKCAGGEENRNTSNLQLVGQKAPIARGDNSLAEPMVDNSRLAILARHNGTVIEGRYERRYLDYDIMVQDGWRFRQRGPHYPRIIATVDAESKLRADRNYYPPLRSSSVDNIRNHPPSPATPVFQPPLNRSPNNRPANGHPYGPQRTPDQKLVIDLPLYQPEDIPPIVPNYPPNFGFGGMENNQPGESGHTPVFTANSNGLLMIDRWPRRNLSQSDEELQYLRFVADVTRDIISCRAFTDRMTLVELQKMRSLFSSIKEVFAANIDRRKQYLDVTKMRNLLLKLLDDIGISQETFLNSASLRSESPLAQQYFSPAYRTVSFHAEDEIKRQLSQPRDSLPAGELVSSSVAIASTFSVQQSSQSVRTEEREKNGFQRIVEQRSHLSLAGKMKNGDYASDFEDDAISLASQDIENILSDNLGYLVNKINEHRHPSMEYGGAYTSHNRSISSTSTKGSVEKTPPGSAAKSKTPAIREKSTRRRSSSAKDTKPTTPAAQDSGRTRTGSSQRSSRHTNYGAGLSLPCTSPELADESSSSARSSTHSNATSNENSFVDSVASTKSSGREKRSTGKKPGGGGVLPLKPPLAPGFLKLPTQAEVFRQTHRLSDPFLSSDDDGNLSISRLPPSNLESRSSLDYGGVEDATGEPVESDKDAESVASEPPSKGNRSSSAGDVSDDEATPKASPRADNELSRSELAQVPEDEDLIISPSPAPRRHQERNIDPRQGLHLPLHLAKTPEPGILVTTASTESPEPDVSLTPTTPRVTLDDSLHAGDAGENQASRILDVAGEAATNSKSPGVNRDITKASNSAASQYHSSKDSISISPHNLEDESNENDVLSPHSAPPRARRRRSLAASISSLDGSHKDHEDPNIEPSTAFEKHMLPVTSNEAQAVMSKEPVTPTAVTPPRHRQRTSTISERDHMVSPSTDGESSPFGSPERRAPIKQTEKPVDSKTHSPDEPHQGDTDDEQSPPPVPQRRHLPVYPNDKSGITGGRDQKEDEDDENEGEDGEDEDKDRDEEEIRKSTLAIATALETLVECDEELEHSNSHVNQSMRSHPRHDSSSDDYEASEGNSEHD